MKLVFIENNRPVTDSRQVATMTEKRHDHLLRDIDGYVLILSNSTAPKFGVSDFFIESTYQDSTGRTLKRYLLTRKGCDMVANKMTGEKGVLFTAQYVTEFEEMEQHLNKPQFALPQNYKEALFALIGQVEKNEVLETEKLMLQQQVKEFEPKASYLDRILQSKDTVSITQIAKDYGLSGQQLNQILHDEKVQYKLSGQWLLYQKYQDKGFTKSQTIDVLHNSGDRTVKMNTKWSQKGRLFIHELLGKQGISPSMDKDHNQAQ